MLRKMKQTFQKIRYKDIEKGAKELSYIAYDLAEWIAIAGIAIMISSFLGLIIFKIMALGGLSAILADLMASTCINSNTIPCDFDSLLGGIGLSLMVITTFFITTMKLITREHVMFADEIGLDENEPCRNYNSAQVETLRVIRALNGEKNLRKFATYMEIPYSTARNYMEIFERDGYIKIHSNGKGTQVEIEVIKQ